MLGRYELTMGHVCVPLTRVCPQLLGSTFKNARLDKIDKEASFDQLLTFMASNRLHRVYVPDAEGGPRSIITLTDVLRVVSGCSIPKVRRHCTLATCCCQCSCPNAC